jgi:hypothetical protein
MSRSAEADEADGPCEAWRQPIYLAGCPVAGTVVAEDSPEGDSKGYCSEEGVAHPMSSRQPGAEQGEHTQRSER